MGWPGDAGYLARRERYTLKHTTDTMKGSMAFLVEANGITGSL